MKAGASFHKIEYSQQFALLETPEDIQILNINLQDTQWNYTFKKKGHKPKIVVLSTVFAGLLELLNQQASIVGVEQIKFYSDVTLLQQHKENKTIEVGEETQLELERILTLKPDILVCNSESFLSSAQGQRLTRAGIKVIYCNNFKESHPLARAEWIKFFGALTGELSKADSVFEQVKNNYNNTLKLAQQQATNLKNKGLQSPLVLAEALFGDTWFVPGGKSYTAQLIEDAGGHYCFKHLQPLFTYPKSLEDVLQVAQEADVWININQFKSSEEMLQQDKRYALFKAFKNKKLYNNNKQENKFGGNAFWESGVGRPDLILKDLYTIFNEPQVDVNQLQFYIAIP